MSKQLKTSDLFPFLRQKSLSLLLVSTMVLVEDHFLVFTTTSPWYIKHGPPCLYPEGSRCGPLPTKGSRSGLLPIQRATICTMASEAMPMKEIIMTLADFTSFMVTKAIQSRRLATAILRGGRERQIFQRLWVKKHQTFSRMHFRSARRERNPSLV